MSTRQPATTLEDQPIPVRAKLAAAWTSFMFLYAYVDILNFYTPGTVDDILDGRVFEFALSQTFSTSALTLMAIPIFMIVLSMTLPARVSRIANLVVAALYVPVTVFNLASESWIVFYGLGVALELILLALILRYAWTWPRTAQSATMATSRDRETVGARAGLNPRGVPVAASVHRGVDLLPDHHWPAGGAYQGPHRQVTSSAPPRDRPGGSRVPPPPWPPRSMQCTAHLPLNRMVVTGPRPAAFAAAYLNAVLLDFRLERPVAGGLPRLVASVHRLTVCVAKETALLCAQRHHRRNRSCHPRVPFRGAVFQRS